jgi:hypothetical protein
MSGDRIKVRGLRQYLASSAPFVSFRSAGIALLAVTGLVALAIPAASAQIDTVTITSVTGSVYPAFNPGQITITVASDSALNELNVEVMSGSTAELSYTLADFTLTGSNTNGLYTLTSPITVGQLAPGNYTIDVTAGDTGGGSTTDDTTQFPWLIQPSITISASQTTFTYNSPSITFAGTLGLVNPDGSAVSPTLLAGQTLDLIGGPEPQPTTTGPGGAYSITVGQPENDTGYAAEIEATPSIGYGESSSIVVQAELDPVDVTAEASATQLNYGQTLTITGTATYNPGTGFVPLTDSAVQVYAGQYESDIEPVKTATTNAEGQYSLSFPDNGTEQWYVYAGGVPDGGFVDEVLAQAFDTATVNVALPVKISGLHASLSPFAILTLKGCLVAGSSGIPPALPLRAQYAAKKSGPWLTLRTVKGTTGTSCGSGSDRGETFKYQVPVKISSAYYRLSYPGSSDWEPANSAIVHEAKDVTRITNFQITPRKVPKGGDVTISGRLWKYAKGWHPLANQHIWIYFYSKGSYYYYLYKPVTSLSGRFKHKFAIPFTAEYYAVYMGGKVFFASVSVRLKVTATSGSAAIGSPRSFMPLPTFDWPSRL